MKLCHIMHVIHSPDPDFLGGAMMSALNLLENLPRERFAVSVLVLTNTEDNLLIRKIEDRAIPVCEGREVRHLSDIDGMRSTFSLLRQQAPDLLHIHNNSFRASPYLPLIARRAGVGLILVTERSNQPKNTSRWARTRKWMIQHSINMTVAVSNAVKDTLVSLYNYDPDHVKVIHNAVDVISISRRTSGVDSQAVRCSLKLAVDALIVGVVANFRPMKGINFFPSSD